MTDPSFRGYLLRAAMVGIVLGGIGAAALMLSGRGIPGASRGAHSFADAVAEALPAVVSIATTRAVDVPVHPLLADPVFRQFLDLPPEAFSERLETGLGSGVVIDARGFVVTNHHVIADTESIQVVPADGRALPAVVVGSDPDSDLAVLRVEADDLTAIAWGNSESVRAGDVVLAIGNPVGFTQTVTQGIVSATGRNRVGISTFENFIQTDAAINPGNSGGALVNTRGELIGINTAILSGAGGFQGIGFAIPSSLLADVVAQILERGYVERGWLGVSASAASGGGVVVQSVVPDGPAAMAGIRRGDLVRAINGRRVTDARRALDLISELEPGAEARLTVQRGPDTLDIAAMVSTRPANITQR